MTRPEQRRDKESGGGSRRRKQACPGIGAQVGGRAMSSEDAAVQQQADSCCLPRAWLGGVVASGRVTHLLGDKAQPGLPR